MSRKFEEESVLVTRSSMTIVFSTCFTPITSIVCAAPIIFWLRSFQRFSTLYCKDFPWYHVRNDQIIHWLIPQCQLNTNHSWNPLLSIQLIITHFSHLCKTLLNDQISDLDLVYNKNFGQDSRHSLLFRIKNQEWRKSC